MFGSMKKAQAIFKSLPPLEWKTSENGKIITVFGNNYTYTIKKNNDGFSILAKEDGKERPLELFVTLYQFKDLDGKEYKFSNPYFTFNTDTGEYNISIRKQVKITDGDKTYYKTVKFYNFAIK